jgi:hypothetical protein
LSNRPIWSPREANPLVKWLARKRENEYLERQVVRIALEVGADLPDRDHPVGALPGDPWLLRGIPAVGVRGGVGGAITGTRPGDGLD